MGRVTRNKAPLEYKSDILMFNGTADLSTKVQAGYIFSMNSLDGARTAPLLVVI